MLLLNK